MLEQHSSTSVIARAQRRAVRERTRATRAAGIADRHEFLAEHGTPQLRVLHLDPPAEPAASLATVADALVHTALLAPDSADPLDLPLLAGADDHTFVHQACGMVAEQLGCDVADGLAILRARAFATGMSLAALAHDIVHKGLRMG